MKRWCTLLTLCTILGFASTVAVAWGLAMFVHPKLADASHYEEQYVEYPTFGGYRVSIPGVERVQWGVIGLAGTTRASRPGEFGMSMANRSGPLLLRSAQGAQPFFQYERLFPRWWGRMPRIDTDDSFDHRLKWVQDARGWPMLALWCEWSDAPIASPLPLAGGIELSQRDVVSVDPFETCHALPCRPIWRGLIVDAVLYGSMWLVLLLAPGSIRRAIRARRGRCVGCGYDLSGVSGKCPECGREGERD